MDRPLSNQFKTQISFLDRFEFQKFIKKLHLEKFGENDFTPLREVRDEGCDGIINSEKTIIACYGPKKYDRKKFEQKAREDFDAYQKNWEANYPYWKVFVNHDVTPDELKFVDRLKNGSTVIGIDGILSIIDALPGYKKRELGDYLRIDKDFFTQDYLGEILENLFRSSEFVLENVNYPSKAPDPIEKFKINYDEEDIETAIQQFDIVEEYFLQIENLLYGYEDEEINKLKLKIIRDFDAYSGSFKKKLESLTNQYLQKYSNESDDDYLLYISSVLFYMFRQCIIGKKIPKEK